METINEDSEFLIDMAGLDSNRVSYGVSNPGSHGERKVVEYFKGVSKDNFLKLYELYRKDFEILGYEVSRELWDSLSED